VGSFAIRSSRARQLVHHLALALCCLAPVLARQSAAQAAPAGPAAAPVAGPSGAIQSPAIPSLTSGQGIQQGTAGLQDANSLDAQRNQQQAQAKTVPNNIAPQPLTAFQQIVAETTGHALGIFGAGLFNGAPSTFAPVDNVPVTPDYLIGPGDELRLQVWGQFNLRGNYVVDRTGLIDLPEVGPVHVAGLQFSQLPDFLKAQLGRVYRNFDLNVNLGQLRSIQIFVVGQARQPGNYTIGSLSTLLNALFASGGPTSQGSLRDIQVKRNGDTITHFDLYDLLLRGDKSKDIRLEPGDVIFIPDAGPQVAVNGSVVTPAIYELQGEKTFNQVIALAGGLTSVASSSKARVERIYHHAERSVVDVDLNTDDNALLQDGDIINISSIIDRFQNAVTLRGNVANPGRYVWRPGMRVSDLIPNRETLVTRGYYLRQTQLGQSGFDYLGPIEGALGIASTAGANSRDGIGAAGGGSSLAGSLSGGGSNFSPRTDVILGEPDIDWNYAVVERQKASDLTTELIPFNLGKVVLDKDPSPDIELLAGDVVTIFSQADIRVPGSQQTKFVKLEGEFVAAGVYSVLPGETLRHLLARAGGLTPDAYIFASEFTRDSVRRQQQQRLQEYADELESQITAATSAKTTSALNDRDAVAAETSAAAARAAVSRLRQAQPSGRIVLPLKPGSNGIDAIPDLPLQNGDRFVVPRVPDTITVEGQVYNPNAFLFAKGRHVRDYLRLAGGPDRIADRRREFVLRADGSVVSRQYGSIGERALFADRNFDDLPVSPGDAVIVPPIIERTAFLRTFSDLATILEGFGLGAAAITVLK
jgi:polysaccharide biosynthesis/export protein